MILSPLEPEDLELLYTIENDPDLWSVGSANVPYSRYALRDYIATQRHDIFADKQVRLVARVEEDAAAAQPAKAVGLVDLFNFSPEHLRAEVGLAILQAERGKGYGRQALRLLTEYARRVLRLHSIYAVVAEDNAASLALFRAAGFTYEQRLKNWISRPDGTWSDAVFLQMTL